MSKLSSFDDKRMKLINIYHERTCSNSESLPIILSETRYEMVHFEKIKYGSKN